MFCHYELYRIRPSSNQGLTKFYLAISSGGMLGGMFVTWVAPLLFSSTYEFIVGIILALIAFALNHKFEKLPQRQIRFIIYLLLLVICWPFVFKQGYNVFGVTLLALTYGWIFSCLKKKPWSMVVGVACLFCALFFVQKQWGANIVGFRMRNYYGIYRISGLNNAIYFSHGNTMHGVQYIDEKRKNEPLAYFNPGSPVGKLLTSDQFAFRNMGFIGLGAGTLAAYGKPGQEIDFYEIDRDVFLIADNFFTYLKNSKAKLSYIFGDARITLKKAKADSYDLLVIDAFSGDSIPIHLITVEAINEYRKVLKDKGVILFHITNNFLDLAPVLYGNSEKTGSRVLLQYQDPTQEEQINKLYIFSYWVAMTWDNDSYERLKNKLAWMPVENTRVRKVRAWTDSYSNILSVLKIGHMLESLRFFTPFSW
jgi:spermidine synthase